MVTTMHRRARSPSSGAWRRPGALGVALVLAGCGDNLPPARDDAATALDAAAVDAAHDAPADAAIIDALSIDAAVIDAAVDAAPDAPTDAPTDAPVDAPTDAPTDAAVDAPELPLPVRLRVVAANLTSGNFQAYEAPGLRILDGLDADVGLVQELNVGGNSPAELRAFVDQAFGPTFVYVRQPGVQIPNGVVSRYPIIESGTWDDPQVDNRDFTWARIDVPGPRDLWAVSLHLLTTSAGNRDAEASALVAAVAARVPAGDLLVLGGDLNTGARTEACITTLGAAVVVTGAQPADQTGDGDTNAGRTRPYDWVLADSDLRAYQIPVAIGAATYDDGLVVDTRVYTPITDLAPALVTDSAAPSMQHMAVVKDFFITE